LNFPFFFLGDSSSSLKFRTQSGTFKDGDLLVNKDGIRIVPEDEAEAVSSSPRFFPFF